jgi:phosphotriesterase-related protein
VECTPVGVGRRADLVHAVSKAADFPVVVPTGVYREPWIPQWAHDMGEAGLYEWMLRELEDCIEGSEVQAGWIKLSAGDAGLTPAETKILQAAARAGRETGAAIGSHTIQGQVVLSQLDIIERCGYTPDRFIAIHAQAEPNFELNLEAARRGAWLSYDWIGNPDLFDDSYYVERIQRLSEAGLGSHILISQDRGWYDPAQPGGGTPKPFTYLSETFISRLKAAGFDEVDIHQLTCDNPFRAFAR